MRFRFTRFDPSRHGRAERFQKLRAVFDLLLMKTGGQVDEALRWMDVLAERHGWFDDAYGLDDFVADLKRDGRVAERGGGGGPRFSLTGKGERGLRQSALERIFQSLAAGGAGEHRSPHPGGAGDETDEARPYAFGDGFDDIAWTPTLRNALGRSAAAGALGSWTLREEDLEVRERERQTGCATVLLVDVSHSMVLYGEDRMMPAREVSLALFELINTHYRKDTLDLVLFGDEARLVPLDRIPYIQAGPYHTNTKAGLQLAQELLSRRRHVNKQIFMITDGKPSAIFRDGELYKNPFGLDEEVVNRTLDEAVRCRRAGITVTTFMVARDPMLVDFVEELTELNRGRAYFTGTGGLASTLFVDYLRNRRAML